MIERRTAGGKRYVVGRRGDWAVIAPLPYEPPAWYRAAFGLGCALLAGVPLLAVAAVIGLLVWVFQ